MFPVLLILLLLMGPAAWGQTPVEVPSGRLVLTLGSLQVPEGTQWQKFAEPGKVLYVGSRQREVFMVTVSKRDGAIPASRKAESLQAYAESYAQETAGNFHAKAVDVRSRPHQRGCEFSFSLSNGIKVVGDYRQGKSEILLLTAMNGSLEDFKAMAASFRASPGKFKPPAYK